VRDNQLYWLLASQALSETSDMELKLEKSGNVTASCRKVTLEIMEIFKSQGGKLDLLCIAMSEVASLLKEIREELKEIRLLYKGLVERLMPVEEPLEDEKEAIETCDEVASEEEVMEALS